MVIQFSIKTDNSFCWQRKKSGQWPKKNKKKKWLPFLRTWLFVHRWFLRKFFFGCCYIICVFWLIGWLKIFCCCCFDSQLGVWREVFDWRAKLKPQNEMPMTSPSSSPSTWAADFRRRSSSHARFVVMRPQQQQSTTAAAGPVKRKTSLLANMLNHQDQQKVSGFLSLQRSSTSGNTGGKFKLLRHSTTVSCNFSCLPTILWALRMFSLFSFVVNDEWRRVNSFNWEGPPFGKLLSILIWHQQQGTNNVTAKKTYPTRTYVTAAPFKSSSNAATTAKPITCVFESHKREREREGKELYTYEIYKQLNSFRCA